MEIINPLTSNLSRENSKIADKTIPSMIIYFFKIS